MCRMGGQDLLVPANEAPLATVVVAQPQVAAASTSMVVGDFDPMRRETMLLSSMHTPSRHPEQIFSSSMRATTSAFSPRRHLGSVGGDVTELPPLAAHGPVPTVVSYVRWEVEAGVVIRTDWFSLYLKTTGGLPDAGDARQPVGAGTRRAAGQAAIGVRPWSARTFAFFFFFTLFSCIIHQ